MHAIVVGGGLVGSLEACFLAKRGFSVDLYEAREDIRLLEHVKGRSINLALSIRGREALKAVGLEEEVVASGIPMRARRIHDTNGRLSSQPYGTEEQYLLSVDRRKLNETLLSAAESNSDVNLHFSHKLLKADFKDGKAVFLNSEGSEVEVTADLIVGCDGAYSTLRRQIMKATRLNYSQEYIPHGYMELTIPPSNDNTFQMEQNFLHIWPRGQFMMIALPNQDKSFTVTLFMPFIMFECIRTREDLLKFFEEQFRDGLRLIGREELCECFFSSKALPLISIKCWPYHVGNNAVILGDAAHAMVPFYGQGMNCGLEDCLVLDEMLGAYGDDLGKALTCYSIKRNPDVKAICDLAMYNYVEMRDLVNSRWFVFRKKIDSILHFFMPNSYIPLYTMVSFTRMRYHHVINKWKSQSKMIDSALIVLFLASILAPTTYFASRKQQWRLW
ncbi:kynurenine 3-monooxygenase-like isoform X2 [Anneissia japonica]|uniref:kynurenine 3-monooxygenase-like isoform X2 n=1 Tax=Anneissia japonica TaxID=1529436 RepID=UPI0014254D2B|nr:kynurenine 3-monooxygenase-like isoform X2 [Anneissia japonica]